MKLISKIFSTFFGVGFAPLAPGTLTSAVIVVLYKVYLFRLAWPVYLGILPLLFVFGAIVSTRYAAQLKIEDPHVIVIDEVLGQMIPLFLLKPEWPLLAAAFLLFRFFDILKPFPINKVESFPEGWGIMLDDIVAGLFAGILINIYLLVV